jgi:hypothetical protein
MDPSILIGPLYGGLSLTFDNPPAAAKACGDAILEILDKTRRERGRPIMS